MTVREIMVASPRACDPEMNCAEAAEHLWAAGCGALPVIDRDRKVIGIVTDRDICIALGTRNRRASELQIRDVMTENVATCRSNDDIHDALKVMHDRKVRRLPVTDGAGKLEGMLCASDLLVHARHDDGSRPELSYENIVNALRGICWHCPHAGR